MGPFGGIKAVWVIVLFDLPSDTPQSRRQCTRFRKSLLNDSFSMMQYSVFMRHCASDENAAVHMSKVRASLPPDGEVRMIKITDKQFGRIQVYYGKRRLPTEQAPAQLEFL